MADLNAELAALRAEIRRKRPEAPDPKPPESAKSGVGHELEAMLTELRDALAEASDETRDAVASHPIATLAAAFLLGIIVGRITGRA